MGSSGNVWVVLRIQQICNTTRHKSPIYGLFALSKRSQRDKQLSANKKDIKSPECLHSWAFFMSFLVIGTQG